MFTDVKLRARRRRSDRRSARSRMPMGAIRVTGSATNKVCFVQALACGAVLIVCGCGGLTPAARQKLLSGDTAYQRGEYRQAQADLDFVVRESPNVPEAAEAYYIRGLCHQQMGHRAA